MLTRLFCTRAKRTPSVTKPLTLNLLPSQEDQHIAIGMATVAV